jgi:hypothetical protein
MLPVAVDRNGDDRVLEARSGVVVVQEHLGIDDRVRKRCVTALLVGVRDVESPTDQVVGEPAGALGVAVQSDGGVVGQAPGVWAAAAGHQLERVDVDVVVGEHAERRDDLFAEVLVLVVAPHHHDVGGEVVEGVTAARQVLHQQLAVMRSRRHAAVGAPFGAHRH